ncbi:conserved exported hypothetical protein [Mesorhizobium metallidurans STM 2683]|uniref:Uncharacterized protein n=1 Tax=Mesorhizobium metallidurans STM 2683 TaxID=1297569 RepID=M5EH46_9HYPH|nr:hypothetical protein [Mesorhizobium metallidurans]CCV03595.1 conserved exported hypothetical protein [Mesorhizobium metallidurans STM 2683]
MVSLRILGALGFVLAAGEAQASSIIILGAPSSTPSVVKLGAPETVTMAESTKAAPSMPSIVALGAAEPDVTYEKVAAIPNQPGHKRGFMPGPMIIRGGIVGGDFSIPAPVTAAAAPQAASGNKTEAANSPPATPQPTPIPETDQAR